MQLTINSTRGNFPSLHFPSPETWKIMTPLSWHLSNISLTGLETMRLLAQKKQTKRKEKGKERKKIQNIFASIC